MKKERRTLIKLILLTVFLSGSAIATEQDFKNQKKGIQNRINEITNKKSNQTDLSKALEMNKNSPFKIPTMIMPTRKITEPTPEERAKQVNADRIEKERKEIAKKSENIAAAYSFLSTYGIQPRENGDLPGEKKLYKLIKDKKIKIKSKRVQKRKTTIRPINMFGEFNR